MDPEAGQKRLGWIESVALTYTPPCIKQLARGKLLHNTGSSALRSVMIQRGGMGDGAGGSPEGGNICIYILIAKSLHHREKLAQYRKAIILQFKNLKI